MRPPAATGFHVFHRLIFHCGSPASGGRTYQPFSPRILVVGEVCKMVMETVKVWWVHLDMVHGLEQLR